MPCLSHLERLRIFLAQFVPHRSGGLANLRIKENEAEVSCQWWVCKRDITMPMSTAWPLDYFKGANASATLLFSNFGVMEPKTGLERSRELVCGAMSRARLRS